MTETAAQLVRKGYKEFLENGTLSNKIANKLYLQLLSMCNAKIYDNDICENNVQQAFYNILNSFKKSNNSSIWQTTLEFTEENDKRLTSYLFKILLTSNRENEQDFWKKETLNLKRAISESITQLVDEKKLNQKGKNYYLAKTESPKSGYSFNFPNILYSIKNKDGSLDWKRLKNLILIIFEDYLENYSLSISNIIEIIAKVADIGNESLVSKDENSDDEEEGSKIEIEDSSAISDNIAIANNYIINWMKRAEKVFTEAELEKRIQLFLMYYKDGLTLAKIVEKVDYNIKKSSVDNYIKQFVNSLEIMNELDNNDPNINYYMNSLILYLSNKYTTIIDAES